MPIKSLISHRHRQGTAWAAASATTWMCHGVDRIFHWETGTTLRNVSGDGRTVNFYEQW
jgi:hypothetical protein